ncbi:hypothetical protein A0H81_09957 [Grifola frondosa]|uniref:Uncharacterized protein n=1 Tax=Grifola frondosa TaxID=5627 RepID=A0A1C7M026_GRIFR|nr:hypothetical protein A0H81_09957 [Grifola frondosa]
MGFRTRNAYYLRISATTVLPSTILPKLREEADAQLGPGGPANAKRGSLDVHRGDTYQFGYFLRKTEPHAVLVKTRHFVAAPNPPKQLSRSKSPPQPQPQRAEKRKKRALKKDAAPKASKKRKTKGKGKQRAIEDEDEAISISSDEDVNIDVSITPAAPRRSARARNLVAGGYREDIDEEMSKDVDDDVDMADPIVDLATDMQATNDAALTSTNVGLDDPSLIAMDQTDDTIPVTVKHEDSEPSLANKAAPPSSMAAVASTGADRESAIELEPDETAPAFEADEDEDVKPKPILELRYRGFNIHDRCLCVIVEPYPPIRPASRAPSLAPTGLIAPRAPSIAPADFIPSGVAARRERTPLFLPDFDERGETPAPALPPQRRMLPRVPLFNEVPSGEDSDSDDGGMMQFSQILRSVGEHAAGAAEDDDEIDGAVFFGDADEMRELL